MPADAKADAGAGGTGRPLPPIAAAGMALAVAFGIVARVAVDSPLWLDEALSVNIADLSFGGIGDALRSEGHPPLYYWLLHAWTAVFGDGDVAARSLSVALGIAAFPLAWIVGRRVGGAVTGAWSLVLVALSPYAVRYSSEVRMYALLMVLVLAGAVLVPDALRSPTGARLAGIAAVTGALIWTHYWSFYLLAVVAAGVLWRWRAAGGGWRAAEAKVEGALAVGGLTFVPGLGRFLDQVRDTGTPWAGPARPAQVVMDTISDLGTGGVTSFSEGVLLGVVVATLAAVGVLGTRPDPDDSGVQLTAATDDAVRPLAVVVFGTLAVGTVVGQLTRSAFNSRYAAVVVPLLLVLAATGLAKLPRRWPAIGGALAVVVLGVVAIVKIDITDRTEADRLARLIAADDAPGDVVVACPDQLGVSLERALAAPAPDLDLLPYPAIDDDPRFIEWRDYEKRNDAADVLAIAAEVDARALGAIWLVWNGSYRTFAGDCERLIEALTVLRGAPQVPGEVSDERAFEHGDLLRFAPG